MSNSLIESCIDAIQGYECDDTYDNLLPTARNYFTEISEILNTVQISTDSAITLNRKMQNMLREFQKIIKNMLKKCQEKYKENEDHLIKPMKSQIRNDTRFKTYSCCGIPYFKNNLNYSAPPNSDYLYRRDVQKELFPVDILKKYTIYWTVNDKTDIINGVKEQVISYLKDGNKADALSARNTRNLKIRTIEKNEKLNSLVLADLLKKTNENFVINWYRISTENLQCRHTEKSCEAMWQMYLRPELNRSAWSKDETIKLENIINNFESNIARMNWSDIALAIGDRSEYQCYVHYTLVISEKLRIQRHKWTKTDDKLLIEAVEKSRMGNLIRWNIVQQYFPNRNKKQLNTRYNYSLDPKIIKRHFSQEEDCIILGAVQKYGEKFSKMPMALFPGRSIVQIRNRYHNTLKYINKHKGWSPEDDQQLLDYVKEYGNTEWRKLSDQFGYHTRISCRQRYTTIMKFFQKNPNATVYDIPRKFKQIQSDITIDNWHTKMANLANIITDKNVVKNNKTYIKTLRSIELKYYNLLKYSYDYKFNEKPFIIYNPLNNLKFLTNLFQLNINKDLLNQYEKSFSIHNYKLLKMLLKLRETEQNINDFNINIKLPPHWSTLLGFRGICIQCTSSEINQEQSDNIKKENMKNENFEISKEKFKSRFNSIFYNTILLTRIDPNTLNIAERFSKNMNLGLKELQVIENDINEEFDNNYAITNMNLKRKSCRDYGENGTMKRTKSENK